MGRDHRWWPAHTVKIVVSSIDDDVDEMRLLFSLLAQHCDGPSRRSRSIRPFRKSHVRQRYMLFLWINNWTVHVQCTWWMQTKRTEFFRVGQIVGWHIFSRLSCACSQLPPLARTKNCPSAAETMSVEQEKSIFNICIDVADIQIVVALFVDIPQNIAERGDIVIHAIECFQLRGGEKHANNARQLPHPARNVVRILGHSCCYITKYKHDIRLCAPQSTLRF